MPITKALPPVKLHLNWKKFEGQTGTLYVIESAGFHKVGISRDFQRRLLAIDTGVPFPVRKVAVRTVALAGMVYAETWMHLKLSASHVKGEWFSAGRDEILPLLPYAVREAERHAAQCRAKYFEFINSVSEEDAAAMREQDARLQREYDERMLAHFKDATAATEASL